MFFTFPQARTHDYAKDPARGIGGLLVIEADSAEHANERMVNDLGMTFEEAPDCCEQCGGRWAPVFWRHRRGEPHEPMVTGRDAYVHYLDGTFKHISEVPTA